MRGSVERLRLRLHRSTSLRTRVAIAAAAAAAAVVALFAVVTSVLLVNNDAAQLDRRLDAIVDTTIDPDRNAAEPRAILQTVRNPTTEQVMYQRGFQLPPLPVGTSTVSVNGVDYRVRTVEREQPDGDVLVSIGIRVDSILVDRARIPLYLLIGGVAVLVAAVLGWLLAGPAVRPLRRLTQHTRRLGGKGGDRLPPCTGSARPRTSRRRCPGCSNGWRRRSNRPLTHCKPRRTSPQTRLTNCARR